MYHIGIENYRQVCFIGIYPEERKIPNTLEFNIKIGLDISSPSEIPDWDYSVISQIVSEVIKQEDHHELLEDVLKKVLIQLKKKFSYHELYIQIKKLNPPTNESVQSSYIEWTENI